MTLSEAIQTLNNFRTRFATLSTEIQSAVASGQCDNAANYKKQYDALYIESENWGRKLLAENRNRTGPERPEFDQLYSEYIQASGGGANSWSKIKTDLVTVVKYCQQSKLPTTSDVSPKIVAINNRLPDVKRAIADAQILSNTDTQGAISKLKTNNTLLNNLFGQLAPISSDLNELKRRGVDTSATQQLYNNTYKMLEDLQNTNAELLVLANKASPPKTPQAQQTSAPSATTGNLIVPELNIPTTTNIDVQEPPSFTNVSGLTGPVQRAIEQFADQDSFNAALNGDWRVKITLAPQSPNILYNVPPEQAGVLRPLQETNGVVFPYTPAINVVYKANYEETMLTHSNYKLLQYSGSSVEGVSIVGDFTAQDTQQADYLLAAIHFFRSVTKMYYGQDSAVRPGTPPPLVYLYGLGQFQFNAHPMVITAFNYSLPNNVNYIRSSNSTTGPGVNKYNTTHISDNDAEQDKLDRLWSNIEQNRNKIAPGGGYSRPTWYMDPSTSYPPTYVPTAMQLQIQAFPVISRNKMSNMYSTEAYSNGELMIGRDIQGGGFW
jgi:hypothetical protein